jgi:hypothetical protein
MKSRLLRKLFQDFSGAERSRAGVFAGRHRTHDVAITYRMNAGFPGDVNRTHPATIEPALIDSGFPPTYYGEAVVADAASPNGVRVPATGDAASVIYGITVRPFPLQQQAATNYGSVSIGAAVPPTSGVIDILKAGYIIVKLQGANASFKGSLVFVCIIAGTSGVVGGFSAVAFGGGAAGTTVALDARSYFNGPADASGNVELAYNI